MLTCKNLAMIIQNLCSSTTVLSVVQAAPDHLHFQGGTSGMLPIQEMWSKLDAAAQPLLRINEVEGIFEIVNFAYPAIAIKSRSVENGAKLFSIVYNSLPQQVDEVEPMMNIVVWKEGLDTVSVIFPRRKHRPDCYQRRATNNI